MITNMNNPDRIIRIVLAIIAIFLGYSISPWFYAITVIFGITAAVGFCPIYKLFGLSTTKTATTTT